MWPQSYYIALAACKCTLVFFECISNTGKYYARLIMHSVWSSIKLTDTSSVFQIFTFPKSESLFLFQLVFLMYGQQLEWGAHYLKFITKQEIDLKFGREANRNSYFWKMLKSDKHIGNIVADARILFVGGIFWGPDINFWRHDVSFGRPESSDITER